MQDHRFNSPRIYRKITWKVRLSNIAPSQLPIPDHFLDTSVGEVWKVPYQDRAAEALHWAKNHQIKQSYKDKFRIALIAIDIQNTFCIPGFELFVSGRSGWGAVEDNIRLCSFVYRNLNSISLIAATMDTHVAMQIFHPIFLVDQNGEHPDPLTSVNLEDIQSGKWQFNPKLAHNLSEDADYGNQYLLHYCQVLESQEKFELTVWPYHALLGGIGHALVSAVEEVFFFHSIARNSQLEVLQKGSNSWTESYSAIGPEVLVDHAGKSIGQQNHRFLEILRTYDRVYIAGQAKSHCVAWTIQDLLDQILDSGEDLFRKVYLLEDCTSPVVVPGIIDYTAAVDQAYRSFSEAGMQIAKSSDPIIY